MNSNSKLKRSEEIIEIFKKYKNNCNSWIITWSYKKASNMVAAYLQSVGYKIVPVYPKEEMILGEKVYRTISEIPFKIDMVDIFRKPDAITEIVDEAIKLGNVDTVWFQLGLVNNEAAAAAKEAGLKVVQNKNV